MRVAGLVLIVPLEGKLMVEMDPERRWETFVIRQTERDSDLGIRVSRSMKRRGVVPR